MIKWAVFMVGVLFRPSVQSLSQQTGCLNVECVLVNYFQCQLFG